MRFWDREKEVSDLKRYLRSEPNAILFVYGPKSSGKSTLLMRVVKELSRMKLFRRKYDIYWYDLRGTLIESYLSVVEIFFEREELEGSEVIKESQVGLGIPNFVGFKVSERVVEEIRGKKLDPFRYMEGVLRSRGRRAVIVFDELQKLKGVYMNSPNNQRSLIGELFNFFVRVTKVLHLAHVLVMTSDTFFIEEIYTSSALKNTSRYYLVDYFDDETAFKILVEEGFSEEDARYAVESIGGVPWMMEEVVESGDPRATIEELYKQHRARLEDILAESYKGGMYEDVVQAIKKALEGSLDVIKDRQIIERLVEKELFFFDPINRTVKFQTKLDEKAARELIK